MPSVETKPAPRIISFLLFFFTVSVIALSILAPFAEHQRLAWSKDLYQFTRSFCHQMPTRCIWVFHSNMAVCSHCFGLLLGICTASFYGWFRHPSALSALLQHKRTRLYRPFVILLAAFLIEVSIQHFHPLQVHPHILRVFTAFGVSFFTTFWLIHVVLGGERRQREVHNARKSEVVAFTPVS